MAKADYNKIKNDGFINQVQKDTFSMRLRISGGILQAEKLVAVYEIAQKYGSGYVHMTSRQSIEVPFIKLEDIESVKEELKKAGLETAACGPCVRTITACQGNAVCSSGLIDTTKLAMEFDERYYGMALTHKFKLGVTGCRNNCLKAEENDLGVKGGMEPSWIQDKCRFCGLCEKACREKAIKVEKEEKELKFDNKKCIKCGRCVKSCPFGAWEGKSGFIVYFGGLYGNRIVVGRQLLPIVFDKEQLFKIVDTTLEFFKKHGKPKERFCNTLDRIGWDTFEKELKEIFK